MRKLDHSLPGLRCKYPEARNMLALTDHTRRAVSCPQLLLSAAPMALTSAVSDQTSILSSW